MNRFTLGVSTAILATFALTAGAADPAPAAPATATQRPKPNTPELSRAQFEALLAKPAELLIIDLRRPDELTRIGGFPVYLSIQSKDLEQNLAWIPKDRKIVAVSNHTARSGRAADFLATKGYRVVGIVGAQTFEEQGGRLTKVEIPPPRNPTAAAAQ
jgi:rhodanese-related sulfurtransferase